jgi:hypothetical protein
MCIPQISRSSVAAATRSDPADWAPLDCTVPPWDAALGLLVFMVASCEFGWSGEA